MIGGFYLCYKLHTCTFHSVKLKLAVFVSETCLIPLSVGIDVQDADITWPFITKELYCSTRYSKGFSESAEHVSTLHTGVVCV